jgi:phthalate 4,5-dioxygenase oxygenase subunit
LSADNEVMCRVGPGTSMGTALRRQWLPLCLTADLPEADCPPLRLKLLGQWLVAFRDSTGKVGALDEACPHRGASLAFGRTEDCGIRCLWHGWKIAVDGTLQDTPNMHERRFKERVRANSYSVVETGGMVWVHLDGREPPPPPDYQWMHVPDDNRLIVPIDLDCNYVQPLEGLADSSHVGVLHSDTINRLAAGLGASDGAALSSDQAPKLVVELTDFGYHYAALRRAPASSYQVRVTAYVAPLLFLIAPGGQAFMSVPQDDTHSRFYNIFWDPDDKLADGPGREQRLTMFGLHDEQLAAAGIVARNPLTGDLGERNHFVQDRDGMRSRTTFSGLPGLTAEDAAMTSSMGPLFDRSNEHLVPADLAVIRLRRALLDIARAGGLPQPSQEMGRTETRRITAMSGVIGSDDDWHELVPQHVVVPAVRAAGEGVDAR